MTRVPFLDLTRHLGAIRDELDDAIRAVLDSGRFIGGAFLERFETQFAEWCGVQYGIGVGSGTDAVTIALQATGIGEGDEVITVANTCVPTVVGIVQAGATPILVDADSRTMTIDPERVAAAIGPRTRAIVPVHLYGRCADMGSILELARRHELKVIEDCAQAHGATYRGRRAGSLGDAAAFSFYPTKNLGAIGDAGMVVTNDDGTADAARRLRSYGERSQYDSVRSDGRNSRLDSLQAAVLSVKLVHLDAWAERRRAIAARYNVAAARAGLNAPDEPLDGQHAFHLYVLRVDDRDSFRAALASAGVDTLVHYPRAVHQHPAYGSIARVGDLQAAERLAATVVSLPLYPELDDTEVGTVTAALGSQLP